jgi:NADH-quinone oxidoreductase subunit E
VEEQLIEQLADILTLDKKARRYVVPLLREAQHKLGYLSRETVQAIADFLEIPGSTVYGIATFYNLFRFTPPGKHEVKVCMGTACHLAGGKLVLEAMERELEIEVGGITLDHEFSLDRVACVGCCALAPVVIISESVYPHMTPPKIEEVLVTIKPVKLVSSTESQA